MGMDVQKIYRKTYLHRIFYSQRKRLCYCQQLRQLVIQKTVFFSDLQEER